MAVYSHTVLPAGSGGAKQVVDTVVDSGDGYTKVIQETAILIGVAGGPYTVVNSANPLPVSIAAAVPVTDNGGILTVDGTVAATRSGDWEVQLFSSIGTAIAASASAISDTGYGLGVRGIGAFKIGDDEGNYIASGITDPDTADRGLVVRTVGKVRLGDASGYLTTSAADTKTGQDVRVVIPAMTNAVSSVLTNAPVLIQAGATELIFLQVENRDAAKNYIQIFDAASAGAVTLGTTVPNLSLHVPTLASREFYLNTKFVAGLVIAATTAYSNSTAPATLPVISYSFR